jgi:cell division protein FtsL
MNPNNPYEQPGTQPQSGPQPPVQPQPPLTSGQPQYGQPVPPQQPAVAPWPAQPQLTSPQPEPLAQPTPQPLAQFNSDYLNQIAPQSKKPVNKFGMIALIGGVLLAAIIAVILLIGSGGPDFATQAKDVQGRINTLQEVADSQQTHLKENDISLANSTLSSALTTMNTDLGTIMKSKGVKGASATKVNPTKTELAYATTLQKKLDDAYQRGTLDRTYTTQMTYELTILRGKLTKLTHSANSKSVTEFSDTAIQNVDAILAAYNKFSSTK